MVNWDLKYAEIAKELRFLIKQVQSVNPHCFISKLRKWKQYGIFQPKQMVYLIE